MNQSHYETGRTTIIQKSTTILLVLLVLAYFKLSRNGTEVLPVQIFRIVLWGLLNIWLYYRGSFVAKWLIIIYTATGGVMLLAYVEPKFDWGMIILAFYTYFYLSYAYELLFSPAVEHYLTVRRHRLSDV